LAKDNSIIRIRNTDEICLARVLAVSISKIEKDSRYRHVLIRDGCKHVIIESLSKTTKYEDEGVLANFCRLHIVLRIP
jgi:hypothetical protein